MKKRKMRKNWFRDHKMNGMKSKGRPCGGGIYFFGFLGAVIYYIQSATSFWMGVLGILKAFIWPAFLVYELLRFLMA